MNSTDERGQFNKMFLLEVKRRRERDFGHFSANMYENDLECDLFCAEDEVECGLQSDLKTEILDQDDKLCCSGEVTTGCMCHMLLLSLFFCYSRAKRRVRHFLGI